MRYSKKLKIKIKKGDVYTPPYTNFRGNQMCVYLVTFDCGSFYIGSTKDFKVRASYYSNKYGLFKSGKHRTVISIKILSVHLREFILRGAEEAAIFKNRANPMLLNKATTVPKGVGKNSIVLYDVNANRFRSVPNDLKCKRVAIMIEQTKQFQETKKQKSFS